MDYFKPWRRKFGVLTLMMACAFCVVWVRSRNIADFVHFRTGRNCADTLVLSDFGITWDRWYVNESDVHKLGTKIPNYRRYSTPPFRCGTVVEMYEATRINLLVDLCGFYFGTCSTDAYPKIEFVIIPFWSIVIPLTLLSAWLLLSKSRHQNKTAEPAEGT